MSNDNESSFTEWLIDASQASQAPVELTAELRSAAAQMFQLFTAFKQAGFSTYEALQLVANMSRPPG